MPSTILYCSDTLRPRRVDTHFSAEAAQVGELGGRIALIDHDALLSGDVAAAVARVPEGLGPTWYRGWMIPPDRYEELAAAVERRGAHLVTTSAMYRGAHELPGWYRELSGLTPASAWTPTPPGVVPSDRQLLDLVSALPAGEGMVKDYVKSRKHEPDACLIPDISDVEQLRAVVSRFVERQDTDLVGGIVLRHREEFRTLDGRVAELRTWWVDGELATSGPHPDTPGATGDPDLGRLAEAVRRLDRRFVTVDLAQRVDGVWRVIELGDGQVSDFPAEGDMTPLLSALLAAP
ncbi:ATP-grasp domain-containing protein [Stackebrandtia endophytica]|uniref:ATP-grasp domain-containing protein n=1 Tax=Stackebrandtia endophytica TaxID=1496996 RepID=UPI00114E95AD|nr:ATP-grasp domain-containing protein [Stackebrandtia endophytica]